MSDPRFQHTAEELRHVADILDVLNAGCTAQSVGAAGGILDIYWCEAKMGVIDRDEETWVYFPGARPVPQRTGDVAWESQEPDAIVRVEVVGSIGYEVWIHSDTFVKPDDATEHARQISKGHPLESVLKWCYESTDVPPEIHDAAAKMLNAGSMAHGFHEA